jgi:hypothetical protein
MNFGNTARQSMINKSMVQFDKNTLRDWKNRGILDITLSLVDGGCAGSRVSVIEGSTEVSSQEKIEDINIHYADSEKSLFKSAIISQVRNKWILKSQDINTRCGCGSSFSLKTDNPIQDKIARMKLAMKQKKE